MDVLIDRVEKSIYRSRVVVVLWCVVFFIHYGSLAYVFGGMHQEFTRNGIPMIIVRGIVTPLPGRINGCSTVFPWCSIRTGNFENVIRAWELVLLFLIGLCSKRYIKTESTKLDIGNSDETFSLKFKSNMTLTAKYVIDGRILILPIQGKGDAKVKVRNVEVEIDSKLIHVKDKAGTHFKLVTPSYKYNIEKTTFQFDNLFNGNKQLSDATHEFANQNWRQLMDDLSPPYIKQIVKTCVKAINKFFFKFTILELIKNYKKN